VSVARKIALIVTGDCGYAALAPCLNGYFAGAAAFSPYPSSSQGERGGGRAKIASFTSHGLEKHIATAQKFSRDELESTVLAKLLFTARAALKDGFDFAIIVDDAELENLQRPDPVQRYVRAVIERMRAFATARFVDVLRSRCSLHLARPMIEAWFFADSNALACAGVANATANLRDPGDAEEFCVSASIDPTFFSAPNASKRDRRDGRAPRWAIEARARHPKAYLDYLVSQTDQGGYDETAHGVAALRALSWAAVLSDQTRMQYARGLVADVHNMLGLDPVRGAMQLWPPPQDPLLRNL
jgi:hypothetical protein